MSESRDLLPTQSECADMKVLNVETAVCRSLLQVAWEKDYEVVGREWQTSKLAARTGLAFCLPCAHSWIDLLSMCCSSETCALEVVLWKLAFAHVITS